MKLAGYNANLILILIMVLLFYFSNKVLRSLVGRLRSPDAVPQDDPSFPPPPDFNNSGYQFWSSYLIDGNTDAAGGRIGMSNFRALCQLCRRSDGATVAAIFTNGGDGDGDTGSWTAKAIDPDIAPLPNLMRLLGRAAGSWYFYVKGRRLSVLDGGTGEFSSSVLLDIEEDWDLHTWHYDFNVTEGRDDEPRIFTAFDDTMKVLARADGGSDGGEWVVEKKVVLSEVTRGLEGYWPLFFSHPLNILTGAPGFVILPTRIGGRWAFSVDVETMEVAPASDDLGAMVYRCELPWPPALHTCLDM